MLAVAATANGSAADAAHHQRPESAAAAARACELVAALATHAAAVGRVEEAEAALRGALTH